MVRSDFCDYSDTYIVVKGKITVTDIHNANMGNKKVTSNDNAPFKSCISKISNPFIDNVDNLAIVMSTYNLLKYSDKYSMTS